MKQISEQKRISLFPCPACFGFHAFEHVCDEQLDPELVYQLEQEIFVSMNVPDCQECGCVRDGYLEKIDGFETYCPDCMLEQYEKEYNQELEDIVKGSKTVEGFY